MTKQNLIDKITQILNKKFDIEPAKKIPWFRDDYPTIRWNDGIKFHASVLYIDLRWSTGLLSNHYDNVVAKILMSYFKWIVDISHENTWEVRSFNWDSLLVFFEGNTKNAINNSVKCAMQIVYFINNVLNPGLTNKWYSTIDFGIWIDHGEILSVKVWANGEDNRDLIWIWESVNFSAKVSDNWKNPSHICISSKIFGNLYDTHKYANWINMWNNGSFMFNNSYKTIYKTNYHWTIK